jgi:ankyrin repeat protein
MQEPFDLRSKQKRLALHSFSLISAACVLSFVSKPLKISDVGRPINQHISFQRVRHMRELRYFLCWSLVNELISSVIFRQVAVGAGRVDKIECLLEIGADPNATDLNGNTFYHLAARDGRAEVVQAFIDDVDLANVNKDGDIPLHLAAKSGSLETVDLLLHKSKLDARNK